MQPSWLPCWERRGELRILVWDPRYSFWILSFTSHRSARSAFDLPWSQPGFDAGHSGFSPDATGAIKIDVAWVHSVALGDGEVASQGDAVIGERLTAGGDIDEVIIYAAAGPVEGELSQYVYAVDEISVVSAPRAPALAASIHSDLCAAPVETGPYGRCHRTRH